MEAELGEATVHIVVEFGLDHHSGEPFVKMRRPVKGSTDLRAWKE